MDGGKSMGVSLTPVGQGRFEIYVDGDLVYNNKAHDISDITIESIRAIGGQVKAKVQAPVSAG